MIDRLVARLLNLAIAWRTGLLVIGVIVLAFAWFPARDLSFDRSIESMFSADDPLLPPYERLKQTFGGNEIALAAYHDADLLTEEGIARLKELSTALKAVDGVRTVLSLSELPPPVEAIHEPGLMNDRLLKLFEGYTVSRDRQTAGLVCVLIPGVPSEERDATIAELRGLVSAHDSTGVLTGEPVMVVEGFRLIEEDGDRLGWVSSLLLMATIILCFRSARWTIAPLIIVNATLILTKAALVVFQFQLSMVSSMLWAIVTVIGIATIIHVIVRFREERDAGANATDAFRACGTALTVAVMWTCLTDAAGFGSLLFAKVGPVADFGVMMATGALVALFSMAILLPGLALDTPLPSMPRRAWGERWLDVTLRKLMDLSLARPKTISFFSAGLLAAAAWGCTRLDVETDFTKNFRARSEIVRSYEFVEENLGGAGVWDVVVPAPAELDLAYLDRLDRLGNRLRNEVRLTGDDGAVGPGLTKVMSLADVIAPFVLKAQEESSGLPEFLRPEKSTITTLALVALQAQMPEIQNSLYGQEPNAEDSSIGRHFARIMLRARERQPAESKRQLIEDVTRICREEFPAAADQPAAEVTGFFVLLANLIDSMVRDQWITFGIAATAILLMMLLAFRRPLVALAAVIPNIMPILLVTGLMGWLDFKINMGAAMIAAVSVGLSVDSSIHYISDFLRRRRAGEGVDEALHGVQQTVGRAATFSTLALIVGFSALCLSDFVPTIYFGVLVGLSMFGGLVGNIGLLPILLRWAVGVESGVWTRIAKG